MQTNDPIQSKPAKPRILFRIVICVAIIICGAAGMAALASLKKPPAAAATKERPLRVEAIRAVAEDVPVIITGHGEVRVLNEVALAPEVSGKVVYTHPRLEPGEIIPAGATLFKIDSINYTAALREADASVTRWRNAVGRLRKQQAIDTKRRQTALRSRKLAHAEFERLARLYEQDKVGTRSGVDAAERTYNTAMDQADQLDRAVALYPMQIKEAQSSLAAAQARRSLALANVQRCTVVAPFDGRLKQVQVETGQFVSPGAQLVTLADDSVLEIHVPLDSIDARNWLQFDNTGATVNTAWFTGLKPVACRVRWTEDNSAAYWPGRLHRVVKFEPRTRTLTVAVRLEKPARAGSKAADFPVVEGMFCSVAIPGKTLRGIFKLPRWAVSFENTVFKAVNRRLQTAPVQVARVDNDFAYVDEGITAGETILITRLVDPLENALLEVNLKELHAVKRIQR